MAFSVWKVGLKFFVNEQHSVSDFKNSFIVHKENTEEITTVAVVLYVIKFHVKHVSLHKL